MKFIMAYDLPDPVTGRTQKQENLAKDHLFSVGELVQVAETGARMFVALCYRDCDGTPLYALEGEPAGSKGKRCYGYEEDGLILAHDDLKLVLELVAEEARKAAAIGLSNDARVLGNLLNVLSRSQLERLEAWK